MWFTEAVATTVGAALARFNFSLLPAAATYYGFKFTTASDSPIGDIADPAVAIEPMTPHMVTAPVNSVTLAVKDEEGAEEQQDKQQPLGEDTTAAAHSKQRRGMYSATNAANDTARFTTSPQQQLFQQGRSLQPDSTGAPDRGRFDSVGNAGIGTDSSSSSVKTVQPVLVSQYLLPLSYYCWPMTLWFQPCGDDNDGEVQRNGETQQKRMRRTLKGNRVVPRSSSSNSSRSRSRSRSWSCSWWLLLPQQLGGYNAAVAAAAPPTEQVVLLPPTSVDDRSGYPSSAGVPPPSVRNRNRIQIGRDVPQRKDVFLVPTSRMLLHKAPAAGAQGQEEESGEGDDGREKEKEGVEEGGSPAAGGGPAQCRVDAAEAQQRRAVVITGSTATPAEATSSRHRIHGFMVDSAEPELLQYLAHVTVGL
ncbi:hypothetical protein Vafri_15776 [Volvox africanus]|nr:hypothetical protein Vafri_15776 [Volvox africanus]